MTFEFGIVNYNGGDALMACIASILALEGAEGRVLVFDNASADRSADEAERRFDTVSIIRSDHNLGYAGAINRMLRQMTAEVVVLCNMDIIFDPGWLAAVADALRQNPATDGVASLVLEMTEPPVVNSAGIRFYPDLHPQNIGSGAQYEPGAYRVEEVVGGYGAVMCFRRSAVENLSFDDDYFLFFEETDFFLRFRLLGGRILFVPSAVVHHHRSLTTGRYSPLKLYYGERNRMTTIFKLLPWWYWPVTVAYSIRRFRRLRGRAPAAAGRISNGMPGPAAIILTILRAWSAALLRLPGTLRKRRAFYRGTVESPRTALRLLKEYPLSDSELSIR